MAIEPPPPPQLRRPTSPFRFSLRALLLLMIVVAVVLSFGLFVPVLVMAALRVLIIGGAAGVCAGGVLHDWDRARVACLGAATAFLAAQIWPRGSSLDLYGNTNPLAVVVSGWLPASIIGEALNLLLNGMLPLVDVLAIALVGGYVAIISAPGWHSWATESRSL